MSQKTVTSHSTNMATNTYLSNNYESKISGNFMKLITLQGHERKMTKTKFNHDGDLLFSAAADNIVCVWDTSTGERLGTYDGNQGTINDFDIDHKSKYLLTGSGGSYITIWNIENGKSLYQYKTYAPISSVQFSCGNKLFLASSREFIKEPSSIHIYKNPTHQITDHEQKEDEEDEDEDKQQEKAWKSISIDNDIEQLNFGVTKAVWSPLNDYIYALCTDNTIRIIDVEKGIQIKKVIFDELTYNKNKQTGSSDMKLTDFRYNHDGDNYNYCSAVVCSRNKKAKLYDISKNKWDVIAEYECNVPLNCIAIHPLLNMITMGGGEEAVETAMSTGKKAKYDPLFYHKILEENIGTINTNVFSPLNSMDWNNDGSQLVLGYEQGQALLFTMGYSFEEGFRKRELELISIGDPSNDD